MTIRYLAVIGTTRTVENPTVVLRETREPGVYRIEVFRDGEWMKDSYFGRYTIDGECCTEEITEDKAKALTSG